MNRQAGFTLIELVVVIIILGILAVTAAPKFIDIQDDARLAAAEGVLGAVKSASTTAYAKALVSNQTGATGSITVQGATVNLVNGYPEASDDGISALVELDGDWGSSSAGGVTTFKDNTCSFTYTESAAANTPPVVGAITGTGCQ